MVKECIHHLLGVSVPSSLSAMLNAPTISDNGVQYEP